MTGARWRSKQRTLCGIPVAYKHKEIVQTLALDRSARELLIVKTRVAALLKDRLVHPLDKVTAAWVAAAHVRITAWPGDYRHVADAAYR